MVKIFPLNEINLIKDIGRFSSENGIKTYLVGGCVRDWLLGKKNKDLDFTADKDPVKIAVYCIEKYGGTCRKFAQFGTYRISLKNGLKIDFARHRSEKYLKPAVLPQVIPAETIGEDLKRRDFTANALAASILSDDFGRIADVCGGLTDIKKGIIRVIHDKSFIDDPTRIFRAARYCGRYGWRLDVKTEKLLLECVAKKIPGLLSRERIRQELFNILEEKNPLKVFDFLKKWNALTYIYPGLKYSELLLKTRSMEVRLGILAAESQGSPPQADEFLKNLNPERNLFLRIKSALEIHYKKASPKKELARVEKEIIKILNPQIAGAGLKPLFINGFDLEKSGFANKTSYSSILDRAACAQWRGGFKNKKQALEWLLRQT